VLARRTLLIAVLLAGCRTPDPVLVKGLKDEIAAIGSFAKIPGDRDAKETARIAADVQKAQAHVDQVAR
jgi:hypothetical protein